ncbi:MAG: aldehyde:ferredoxin oxidoreductase [Proteobacteria bacterium]|nr:aldehyde:ferredoxin oxidoreductase [Pseudomonadota bacterium]
MDTFINNVLIIDLSKHAYHIEKREAYFNEYLGGTGAGIQLLKEFLDPKADPLSPENVIVFSVGTLTGKFPMVSKTVALFKSPHNGYLGESHAGGRSAISIWQAGYGAIVIKGASQIPVYVVIDGKAVHFRDARALWGVNDMAVAGRIMRERDGKSGLRTIMRIGKAGERLITYSSLTTETYRHFGRLGLGAVFGSKKLKGLVVTGTRTVPVENKKEYKALYDQIYTSCVSSSTKKYHELGTAENILPLNALSALPTRNFQETSFEKAEVLSGENLAEAHLGRRVACSHCPVGCIHLAVLREKYPDDPYFYKTSFVCYDYEPLYSVGSLLGIQTVEAFLKIMITVEKYGIDVITTGVILGWTTEAYAKGLIGREQTGGISPAFGDAGGYIELIEKMIEPDNEFFELMGKGLDALTKRYGGSEFAVNYFGNELSGYHTGPSIHLTHITGARHSHLDSAGYSIDQKMLRKGALLPPEELAKQLFNEEAERQVLTSLVICLFARNIYTMERVSRCLKLFGLDVSEDRLREIGKKILMEKNALKREMGFDMENFTIPERVLTVPTPSGRIDPSYLRETAKHFKNLLL